MTARAHGSGPRSFPRRSNKYPRKKISSPSPAPTIKVAVELRGRTKPSSCEGVRDKRAQSSTRAALSGAKMKLPARMARIARSPRGPNPRSLAARGSPEGAATNWNVSQDKTSGKTWSGGGPRVQPVELHPMAGTTLRPASVQPVELDIGPRGRLDM